MSGAAPSPRLSLNFPSTTSSSASSHTDHDDRGDRTGGSSFSIGSGHGQDQRLLSGSTPDHSVEGFYPGAQAAGAAGLGRPSGARRPGSRVPSTTARSTGVPALSEKLNPRGNSIGGGIPAMSLAGTGAGTTVVDHGPYQNDWSSSKDHKYGKMGPSYAIDANPYSWDTKDGQAEPDDYLHDPRDDKRGNWLSGGFPIRAILNIGALAILAGGIFALFAGYPIISWYQSHHATTQGGYNLGGTNASGQVTELAGMRSGLIDPDTPEDAMTRISDVDGSTLQLVFSDEFNTDGRSFYPNDDPFWEAVDLHYWATNNYEWYDPAAVTTSDGALQITLSQYEEHDLNFRGGMIQSWNKFCFTGGYVSASVRLPGSSKVAGLWPAFWLMGNLGRAGYGATLEGTWPYTYDSCDVGTLQNQTFVNNTPTAALTGGAVGFNKKHGSNALSFLAGQRLSACTCPGDDHPGPAASDGTYPGRSAPEIDVFEAQVGTNTEGEDVMQVSQSGQWAPFNQYYAVTNTSGPAYEFFQGGSYNVYTGELTQQSTSGVTPTPQNAVEYGGNSSFAEFGLEYEPGNDGYIEWVSGGAPSWRVNSAAMDPDPVSEISRRPFPMEPMYILFNLGISQNFGTPVWNKLHWPNTMSIDWVRVYQKADEINVGCDPDDFPTADYITKHSEAYNNPNLTLWGNTAEEGGYGAYWPRNRLNPNGCDAELSIYPGSPTEPKAKAPARASSVASNWDENGATD